jgi:hypothetical protein
MTNEDRPAAPRRRLPLGSACLVLLGVLLAWRLWPHLAPVEEPPGSGWLSPLDVLDPARLADNAWPRDARPAEAVGVLKLDRDADDRLAVSIADRIILIKDARGKEVARIEGYAPPKPPPPPPPRSPIRLPNGQIIDANVFEMPKIDPQVLHNLQNFGGGANPMFGNPRDDHTLFGAALSPKADRLVVLGHTRHIAGPMSKMSGHDADWSGAWAQVWRWEGKTLTPLEAQPHEGEVELFGKDPATYAAAFSPDGKLLASGSENRTDVWEVGEKKLKHLGKIAGKSEQLLFAPDGRSLAVIKPGSAGVYDLGPLLPESSGWPRWRLFFVALGLGVAAAVILLLPGPTEGARARRQLRIATTAAFVGAGACVAWWAWRPVPAGAPLTVGLGFGAALAVRLLLGCVYRHWRENVWRRDSAEGLLFLVTVLGAIVCLVSWAWQFWWPSASLRTPSGSDLASADIRSVCFSADGSELAAVRFDGRLSRFDVTTGKETHGWRMPVGVLRPEYAADGRHLLAVAEGKAYVLRLKPLDDTASVLSCCEQVLAQHPKAVHALLARGHVRLHKGELDSAIADFTAVIAQDAKHAAAYYGRGLARTDRGDYAGARADFAAALRHDPKLAAAVSRRPSP